MKLLKAVLANAGHLCTKPSSTVLAMLGHSDTVDKAPFWKRILASRLIPILLGIAVGTGGINVSTFVEILDAFNSAGVTTTNEILSP
jgi:hypothetical protein